ncbi:CU044_2847 family protein [Actinomycetes bacterium KLBMP 9797]
MSGLLRIELPTGQQVWANVSANGPADVSLPQAMHKLDLEDLRNTIAGVTQSVHAAIETVQPDQLSVEFGVELAMKTGKLTSVLAEVSGNASLKITMSWGADPKATETKNAG